jgi:hypothetical protein
MYTILLYMEVLFYVCRPNKMHPNRSILSLSMTAKKFISCSSFCSHLNLVALEKILTQRHRIITHGHAAAITLLLLLLIFALLALFLCLRYLALSLLLCCVRILLVVVAYSNNKDSQLVARVLYTLSYIINLSSSNGIFLLLFYSKAN